MPTKLFYERLDAAAIHLVASIYQHDMWALYIATDVFDEFMQRDPEAIAPALLRAFAHCGRSPQDFQDYVILSPSSCPAPPRRNQYSRS